MALTLLFTVLITLAISAQASPGYNVECENLNEDSCTYAVSSSGKRCGLEKRLIGIGYTCRTSEITADKLKDWIETEECISACGVDRNAVGISSDSLLDRVFVGSLCSKSCYDNCPNIVDLYFNLAAGEGVYLPRFCESKKRDRRREMVELRRSGNRAGASALSPSGKQMLKLTRGGSSGLSPGGEPLDLSSIIIESGGSPAASPGEF